MKRILTLSGTAVINLINGLFNTSHPTDAPVLYHWTEHTDDDLNRTIADTILTIDHIYIYHLEAQMYQDDEIEFPCLIMATNMLWTTAGIRIT